jgi:hypothetical protein
MRIAITGSRSLPADSLTFLTLKLDRLTAKLNRAKLVILTRMVEGLVHEWAHRSHLTYLVFHDESDKEMLEDVDAVIVIRGPKKVKENDGLERAAQKAGIVMKTIKWKDKK